MRSKWKRCMPLAVFLLCLILAIPVSAAEEAPDAHISMVAVRSGPSEKAGIIGWLADGQAVTVLDSEQAYYRIDCYDMTGYVHKQLVASGEDGFAICAAEGFDVLAVQPALPAGKVALLQQRLVKTALSLRGVPYVWGGTTPRGFDCSGFTQYVMRQVGLSLHRSALQQLQDGVIIAKSELQCGDLVFFQNTTGSGRFASHIGIYIGNGELIHAGSKGITVVDLESMYFTYHYLCARRVALSDLAPTTVIPFTGSLQHNTTSYWRENAQTGE